MDIQVLGFDVGRGYFKGYTVFNGIEHECMFKSMTALGRHMDTSKHKDPIYIEYNEAKYFVGELAEKQGHGAVHNLKDDKTTDVVDQLIATGLLKLAMSDKVKIVLGVPNKLFNKLNMEKIKEYYKGKRYTVKDQITNTYKKTTIIDITIFREGDAALLWYTKDRDRMDKPFGMVTVGFRTTEYSYFDEDFIFNDKLSKTEEDGNQTALEYVKTELSAKGIMKTLSEIDSSSKYDNLKKPAYSMLKARMETEIEKTWLNLSEMEIKIAGGTAHHLEGLSYEIIPDSQMATARGLFYVGEELF